MAAYTTYAILDNEIVNMAEHVPADKDSATWVAAQITNVQAEIDGRLAARYVVPFVTVPVLIQTIALYLAASRVLNPGYVGEIPAESAYVDTYYKRGNDLLKQLETGELTLTGITPATSSLPLSSVSDTDRVFTQTTYDEDGDVLEEGFRCRI